jgi:MFS family permease
MNFHRSSQFKPLLSKAVVLGSLGFFVDSFDLALFQIVRVDSLKDLGFVTSEETLQYGVNLLNAQMIGLFIGGFLWGFLGDRFSRVKALLFSVLTYSLACIANAFVVDIPGYLACRLVAGIGMAGELGLSVTLITESLPKHLRGYGTVIISAFGTLGFVVAGSVANFLPWREMYILGGVLGFLIMILRFNLKEAKTFKSASEMAHKGNLLLFLRSKKRLIRFLKCVSLGLPTWFANAIMLTFCYEIGLQKGLNLSPDTAVIVCIPCAIFGDAVLGALSQYLKTRRKVMLYGLSIGIIFLALGLFLSLNEAMYYIFLCALFLSVNFWTIFITTTAEQFGTNIRATATTLAPNFVRGGIVIVSLAFKELTNFVSPTQSAAIVGFTIYLIAILAVVFLKESSELNLDYNEK